MLPGSINQYWEYDGYRRNYEIRTLLGEKQVLKTTLYHEVPGTNYVSTRVISWKNETGASGTRQFDYAYDSSGNITMMRIGGKSTMYQYNGLQQLTRKNLGVYL